MTTKHIAISVRRGAPGDTIAASALVRDLATFRPDYRLSVAGAFAEDFFRYDPRVVLGVLPDAVPVEICYRRATDDAAKDKSRRYLGAAHECYRLQTGDRIPLAAARPSLILGPNERVPPYEHPYAIVASGVKSDIPLKQAPPRLFDEAVAATSDLNWKQVGRTEDGRLRHTHHPIPGAENLLGVTDIRGLVRLVAHARVVLCHVSLPMLLAAAFRVPCVVLGGGRESPWFHACPTTTYLHTIGRLACCLTAGCQASFVRPAHADSPYPPGSLCAEPADADGVPVGRCMTLLTPAEVVAAVRAAVGGRRPLN